MLNTYYSTLNLLESVGGRVSGTSNQREGGRGACRTSQFILGLSRTTPPHTRITTTHTANLRESVLHQPARVCIVRGTRAGSSNGRGLIGAIGGLPAAKVLGSGPGKQPGRSCPAPAEGWGEDYHGMRQLNSDNGRRRCGEINQTPCAN